MTYTAAWIWKTETVKPGTIRLAIVANARCLLDVKKRRFKNCRPINTSRAFWIFHKADAFGLFQLVSCVSVIMSVSVSETRISAIAWIRKTEWNWSMAPLIERFQTHSALWHIQNARRLLDNFWIVVSSRPIGIVHSKPNSAKLQFRRLSSIFFTTFYELGKMEPRFVKSSLLGNCGCQSSDHGFQNCKVVFATLNRNLRNVECYHDAMARAFVCHVAGAVVCCHRWTG